MVTKQATQKVACLSLPVRELWRLTQTNWIPSKNPGYNSVFVTKGPGMELKDLTVAMHRFVEAKGWYAPGSRRPQSPRNIAISLVLEASELLEHFQWSDTARDPDEIPGELADVTLYLLQLSSILGIDLEQAVMSKLERNYGRTWDQDQEQS